MRVDPLYSYGMSASLNDLTGVENNLTAQLSSGLRVANASDDPLAASQSVKLGSAIARDDAYVQAASGVTSRLQVADSALGSVVAQITSAITTAVQGTGGTMNAANLQAVSQQLAGIRDEVVSLANSSYAGSYLFAGTGGGQPYTNDSSTTPATAVYAGDDNQQFTATPTGQQLVTGLAGNAIFSASGTDGFTPDCTVCYYPGGIGKVAKEALVCPVLVHVGGSDDHIGSDQIDAVREAHPEVKIYSYAGAGHAFANPDRPSYVAEAARLADQRSLEFLKTHLG